MAGLKKTGPARKARKRRAAGSPWAHHPLNDNDRMESYSRERWLQAQHRTDDFAELDEVDHPARRWR